MYNRNGTYDRKSEVAGFTIAEALFYFSAVSLISVFTFTFITRIEDNSISNKLKSDFALITEVVSSYNKGHVTPPCHSHSMSNVNELEWSKNDGSTWPQKSPVDTIYFLSHTGDIDAPKITDYNYIGVVLDSKNALKYDILYDDGSLEKGNFRFVPEPLPHYSYLLSYIKSGSHSHCE